MADVIDVSIKTMKLSGDREEHYVCISCGGREVETRKYPGEFRNRAEYEVAELRHVLLNEPKPDLMDAAYADGDAGTPMHTYLLKFAGVWLTGEMIVSAPTFKEACDIGDAELERRRVVPMSSNTVSKVQRDPERVVEIPAGQPFVHVITDGDY